MKSCLINSTNKMQLVPLLTDAKAINRAETQMDKIRSELVKMILWFMLISHNIKNHWEVKWITLIISLQWHLSEHLQNGTSCRVVSPQDLPFWLVPTKSGAKDNLTPVHHWKWLQWHVSVWTGPWRNRRRLPGASFIKRAYAQIWS